MFATFMLAAVAALTPAQIDTVLQKAEAAFHDYVFPNVAQRAVAMLEKNERRYEGIADPQTFVKTVNADLYEVTHDRHVRIRYPYNPAMVGGTASEAEMHSEELRDNYGFQAVRRLPGNVGYIDFRYFSDDAGAGAVIADAMGFVANTRALIIDLRANGGGSPRAAQTLEAYFFPDQQQVTSLMIRDPKSGAVSEMQQYTAATVPGPLYLNKPVYLLTSSHTFSCAEQFVYDLHNLKRVTLVGETTGGGANPGGVKPLAYDMAIFIPTGRAYSPVTKTNWEGSGIAPDVSTPSADALVNGYQVALKTVRKTTSDSDALAAIDKAIADPAKALATGP